MEEPRVVVTSDRSRVSMSSRGMGAPPLSTILDLGALAMAAFLTLAIFRKLEDVGGGRGGRNRKDTQDRVKTLAGKLKGRFKSGQPLKIKLQGAPPERLSSNRQFKPQGGGVYLWLAGLTRPPPMSPKRSPISARIKRFFRTHRTGPCPRPACALRARARGRL